MLVTDVENRILKAMLLKFKIDEEEIFYENEEDIICPQNNINEKSKAVFFATSHRVGFVTNVGAYYFTNVSYVRDMIFDSNNNNIRLVLTSCETVWDSSKDYIIDILESENYDTLNEALAPVILFRLETSLETTYNAFKESIEDAYNCDYKAALIKADSISKIDPLTMCNLLLKMKIYSAMGEFKKVEVLFASKYDYLSNMSIECFVDFIYKIDWDYESRRYLPPIGAENNIRNLCLKYINYCIDGKKDKMNEMVLEISKELIKSGNLGPIVLSNLEYISRYITDADKETFNELGDFTLKMIMLLKNKSSEAEMKERYDEVAKEAQVLLKSPYEFRIKHELNDYTDKIIRGEYDETLEKEYEKVECEIPEEFDLKDILSLEITDNEVEFCKYFISRVFCELRNKSVKHQDLLMKLNNLNNIITNQDNRIFKLKCEEEMLYYMEAIEIYILNGQRREALKLCVDFKKKAKLWSSIMMNRISPYSIDIAAFYEAYALDSLCEMKKYASKLPKELFGWIHSIFNDKEKSVSEIDSEDTALNCINNMLRRFTSLTNDEDVINDENRRLIEESIENIEDKLHDDELRIAIIGETSAGKTTFLNTMFNTDLFFATQEEATGVATEIRKGDKVEIEVIDKEGNIRSAYNTSSGSWFNEIVEMKEPLHPTKENLLSKIFGKKKNEVVNEQNNLQSMDPKDFVAMHTKVGEESLEWVNKVRVKLPIDNLLENVVIVDTPGFNANDKRTEIAKGEISNAHVCLFLIDARNALKKKEMEMLNLVEDESGRVFFVLNKMDSVTYDEDLDDDDCEDINDMIKNVSENLVERVREGIMEHLKLDSVKVYTVTSIYKDSYEDKIKEFYNNIEVVKKDIFDESSAKKLDLIIDMAAKEAIKFSKIFENINTEIVKKLEEEEEELIGNLPSDPEVFKTYVEDKVFGKLASLRDDYVDKVSEVINHKFDIANKKFKKWLENVEDKNELKNAQVSAEKILQCMIEDIAEVKEEELSKISNEILNEIVSVFCDLYSGLSFNASFNSEDILQYSSGLNNNLSSSVRTVDGTTFKNNAAQIICAGIGLAFGPIGALIGGFIGSALFGTSIDEIKERVWDAYSTALSDTYNSIINTCNDELNLQNYDSFINKFYEIVENQIIKYESMINNKINVTNNSLAENNIMLHKFKEKYFRINDEIYLLKKWRNCRL